MTMEELKVAVSIVAPILGAFWLLVQVVVRQFERRLDERFSAQEERRKEAARGWDARFATMAAQHTEEMKRLASLERDVLQLRADLPLQYVRREDSVREATVVNAKLDALNARLDSVLYKRGEM